MESSLSVSEDLFYVLLKADGRSTLDELYRACDVREGSRQTLNDEVCSLWQARGIILTP
jgi:hypothetical protein